LRIGVARSLDRLDIHILRAMTQGNTLFPGVPGLRMSFRAIAKSLQVSEGTIRMRVGKMSASGVIAGETVFVNPSLLGLTCGVYGFQVSTTVPKKEVLDSLKLVDGIVIIQNHHGSFIGTTFVYESKEELQEKTALINKLAHCEVGFFDVMPFPSCSISLTSLEWKLVSRLVKGKIQSLKILAGDLGLSERTLKRLLSKLVDSDAIFTIPILDLNKIKGSVPADMVCFFTSPESRSHAEPRVLQAIDDYAFFTGICKGEGLYNLILPNAAVATELYEKVVKFEGVSFLLVELVDGRYDQTELLGDYVQRRISLIPELASVKI